METMVALRCWWLALALGLSVEFAPASFPGPGLPQTQDLKGEVLDEQNAPISDAICTLEGRILPSEGLSTTTDVKGKFDYPGLLPETYTLTCAAEGFRPLVKNDLKVTEEGVPLLQLVLPREAVLRQTVEVREKSSSVAQEQVALPTVLSDPQIKSLPLVEMKFKAALPVVPGVIRSPNGEINIKGVAESRSLLLIDSADTVDPVTGNFYISLPLEAIQSMDVYKTTFRAEYGGFAGGLTSIQTRAPASQFHFEVQAITPNPRIKDGGHIVGIADYNPRVYLTGPLWKDRLNFAEAFEYDVDKIPVRGLAWPNDEIRTHGWNSFTSLQYIVSPQHLLSTNVNIFPLYQQYLNINSLVPQTASADLGQQGISASVTDRYLFGSGGVLTTLFQTLWFYSYSHAQGAENMVITPTGWSGNFFNAYTRHSNQQELLQTYQLPQKQWHGKHTLTVGGSLVYRGYEGSSVSHPVELLRQDGTLEELLNFAGAGLLAANNTEPALFAQDHWEFGEGLALDAGLRYSGQSLGQWVSFAPRIGLTYSPGKSGRTILRGGVGVFNTRVPLLAGDFTSNQTRVVTLFDPAEQPLGPPIPFNNEYEILNDKNQPVLTTSQHLQSTPLNVTWSLEADRELRPHMTLRFSFLDSRTVSEFIVGPTVHPNGAAALVLSNTGVSRYQGLEFTLHYRPTSNIEFNCSYVYSHARGDLNTVGQVYVPFQQPVIRPNTFADLASDIPNRLVTWGRFNTHLWGINAGPLLDWHTGFPFSFIDARQDYVGQPNSHRFPRFFSLDLKLSREFRSRRLPFLKNHVLRGALTVLNVTNNPNPRDVYNTVTSPYFLHFVGLQHYFFQTAFDVLY
jgi:outer membrane receptor for ferrienterochelin and colicin